ncbi:MAG: GTP-binding protein [Ardenticatenaceae bacterium]|nr:GTP-binding protein [Ardenticatenaceae bacterium]MCB9443329.1 GTP-binding protein [Ardenticatenaceae bacterium]
MNGRVVQKKICLLGDFAVGKTSLIRRFVEGRFDDRYLSTIGVKISRKPIDMADFTLNLLIWDLAGGDDFSKTGASYLRGAVAALIVCDLTRPDTLAGYEFYAHQMRQIVPDAILIFAGNKADLTEERALSVEELQTLVQQLGGTYLDTSAKSGYQVEKAFQLLAQQLTE